MGAPKQQLTLFDTTCIIVGIIIGAGIYETTPMVAQSVGSAGALLAVWVLGGVVALIGAACYVELATAYPREGGDYVFLTRAYGRRAGFVFVWAEFWIIRPGNIGMMAYVFARYARDLFALNLASSTGSYDYAAYACGAVVLLGLVNIMGVRSGKWTQNTLTTLKVLGLVAIFAVGMYGVKAEPTDIVPSEPRIPLAVVLVLFTYGGWNEMSYVAAEVRDPHRNILRALVAGSLIVCLVYVMANLAFLNVLGLEGMRQSTALAADVVRPALGDRAARMMSLLVCISCLGSINGMIFTGSRIYYALGTESRLFGWLGRWSDRLDSPTRAIVLQTIVATALVLGFGGPERVAEGAGAGTVAERGFERLLNFTTPVFWFFIFMVAVALLILRYKDHDVPRPHRVWLYPWTPLAFCLSVAYLFWSSFEYALGTLTSAATWAAVIMAAGVFIAMATGRDDRPA